MRALRRGQRSPRARGSRCFLSILIGLDDAGGTKAMYVCPLASRSEETGADYAVTHMSLQQFEEQERRRLPLERPGGGAT